MKKLKNVDLVCAGFVIGFLLLIWYFMRKHPSGVVDRKSPLPSGLYTNGAPAGMSNNVAQRVNFQQQPVGNSFS